MNLSYSTYIPETTQHCFESEGQIEPLKQGKQQQQQQQQWDFTFAFLQRDCIRVGVQFCS